MTVKATLIGYGAIAREICAQFQTHDSVHIKQILVRPARVSAVQSQVSPTTTVISDVAQIETDIDIVLECAGHEAVFAYAAPILERGIRFGIVSVGATADQAQFDRLKQAQQKAGAQLIVLPGAIGGIDALASAGPRLKTVRYISRKPPLSWRGSPAEDTFDLSALTDPTEIFTGTAREAALRFPKNANVVATVAMAGIGFESTRVSLMADPAANGNSHQIIAQGPLFDLDYTTKGAALHSNPKTSALTAYSAVRLLRNLGSGIVV
ncbi:MAG: aspartate dehydrogenase [Roseobacter sp.]